MAEKAKPKPKSEIKETESVNLKKYMNPNNINFTISDTAKASGKLMGPKYWDNVMLTIHNFNTQISVKYRNVLEQYYFN